MVTNLSISDLFTYPKFSRLVNLPTEGEGISLDQNTRIWVESILVKHFNDEIKIVSPYRIRPWSQIFKIETIHKGLFFLKIPASEFRQEAQIVELIEHFDSDITVKILARNENNGSFLMAALDGETLRATARKHLDPIMLEDGASIIGKFQKKAREFISEFEKLDIPKWTPKIIIENLEALINDSRFLFHSEISNESINELRSLFPFIQEKLDILIDFDHGLSIDHGDFQDNNLFVSEGRMLLMDWADSTITIPSFTIGTYCHSLLLAHPNIADKYKLIHNVLETYYFELIGLEYHELYQCHALLVHFLYPVICILKVERILNLQVQESDKYAAAIIDYWIRVVISFAEVYRNQSLRNEII